MVIPCSLQETELKAQVRMNHESRKGRGRDRLSETFPVRQKPRHTPKRRSRNMQSPNKGPIGARHPFNPLEWVDPDCLLGQTARNSTRELRTQELA